MDDSLLEESGLNNHFPEGVTSFETYITAMRKIILTTRPDVTQETSPILEANAPFAHTPEPNHSRTGVLLIHGLYASPYQMRDIADRCHAAGFKTYALLLPGHGTVPGDLLNIHHSTWFDAVDFAVSALDKEVDNIFIAGNSLGAALAIHHVLHDHQRVKGLLLLAPGLKPQHPFAYLSLHTLKLFGFYTKMTQWYVRCPPLCYTHYTSFAVNGGLQAVHVMHKIKRELGHKKLDIPVFIAASEQDETVCTQTAINFFKRQDHPENNMLLYTKNKISAPHPQIEIRTSVYPDQNIVDFSHPCIPIAPENPIYGQHGTFEDFLHYTHDEHRHATEIHQGARSKENLKKYTLRRLGYNPDFDYMSDRMIDFIHRTI